MREIVHEPSRAGAGEQALDLTKVRTGDTLLLRVKADRNGGGDLAIRLQGELGNFDGSEDYQYIAPEGPVDPANIVAHEAPPYRVGDRVWGLTTKCDGEVLHVVGDLAWVKFEDGRHEVVLPSQVERHQ